jgi:hypothetical protein
MALFQKSCEKQHPRYSNPNARGRLTVITSAMQWPTITLRDPALERLMKSACSS